MPFSITLNNEQYASVIFALCLTEVKFGEEPQAQTMSEVINHITKNVKII